ncbi:hypothetical protein ACFVIM_21365 [Streptomyces sp. NPDC057638]|uniref:hypothetical protein n=1 Tax=Streptomyces sp. NPDC057638 TaxID=3346190 RepID=UPI00368DE57D
MEAHTLPMVGGPLDGLSMVATHLEPLALHPIGSPDLGGCYELFDHSVRGLILMWHSGTP